MGVKEIVELIDALVSIRTGNTLSYIHKTILAESLQDTKKTYDQIAQENGYSPSYLKNGAAPKLWHLLSEVLGEKVNKINCRFLLEKKLFNSQGIDENKVKELSEVLRIESPEGQVPLASKFYIERSPIEATCYQEIQKPQSLILIKAPRQMGKTSLMVRMLALARSQGFKTVQISLNQAESKVFTSTEKFLRWLCANTARQLELDPQLDEYWDEDMGALVSCTLYFQGYLLSQIQSPIILAIDEVNQLCDSPSLTRDIFALLRSWHEETRDLSEWQKLRLLLLNSTEIYRPLDLNKSPFNISYYSVELLPFNREQVMDLAQRHGLNLSLVLLEELINLTGGFPYLLRLAFYHSIRYEINLTTILETATHETGIYKHHLHQQAWYLQQHPDLAIAYQEIMTTSKPVQLNPVQVFQLKSMGFIYLEGDQVTVSCGLYRQYFKSLFGVLD